MHVFYTPDIQKTNELPEEEAQHCTRVLRLSIGDEITLTEQAIKDENYELAAKIRDQINQRNKNQ